MKTGLLLTFTLVLLIASSPAIAQQRDSIREVPADTAGLIELLDAESGDDPELLYGWLMAPNKRPADESQNAELRAAVERLMHRASGYTLKFAFNRWSALSGFQKEELTAKQVTFALSLLENPDFISLTEDGWGRELPYRFRFASPIGLLRAASTQATELITAQLNHETPIVRAAAVDILAVRSLRKLPVHDIDFVIDRIVELAGDPAPMVRSSVATALGMLSTPEPANIVTALRGLCNDDVESIRMHALLSVRPLAEHIPSDFAIALAAMVRDNGLPVQSRISSALEKITEYATSDTCDAIIDEVFPLLDPVQTAMRNRAVEIVAFAARNSSPAQRRRVAEALIEVIASSDDIDEMLAVHGLGGLGNKLAPATRWAAVDELSKIIEGPLKDREVRMDQAATAGLQIVPFLTDDQRQLVASRMIPMLKRHKKVQPAARMIGAAGPIAKAAVADLRRLAVGKPSWNSLTAARALWDVQPDAALCGKSFVRCLQQGPDMTHKQAEWALVAMGDEAIIVLDDLIELLKHKQAYDEALEVIANLGSPAAKAAEQVKPFLDSPSLPASKAARRAMESFHLSFEK